MASGEVLSIVGSTGRLRWEGVLFLSTQYTKLGREILGISVLKDLRITPVSTISKGLQDFGKNHNKVRLFESRLTLTLG